MFRSIIQKIFYLFGFRLMHLRPAAVSDPAHLWETDARFQELYRDVQARTVVDKTRCFIIYQALLQTSGLEGDAAEVGVYRGGTAALIARTLRGTKKTVYIFDTFTGMPQTDARRDLHRTGDFGDIALRDVRQFLRNDVNVVITPGVFPESGAVIAGKTFSFVHLDVDIYRSVRNALEFFYPRLARGGILLCDDYGFLSCPGAREAVDKFFISKPETPIYLPTGQSMVIKI
jgi:O-methyltransferase